MSHFGILFTLFALTFALSYEVNEENNNDYEKDVLDNLEDSELHDSDSKDDSEDNEKEILESYEDNDPFQSNIKMQRLEQPHLKYSKRQYNFARACEGYNLIINCHGHGKIKVVYANYGRTSSRICSRRRSFFRRIINPIYLRNNCDNHKSSTKEVRSRCSGRSSCIVQASNGVFGDPCFGTYKYLEVQFYCKRKHHFIHHI
ncbi:latrophilin Cirl [Hydra vulgaris]|uniref:latrophilin Cirl n=1 Tax=Hydra vulgaris TaxID=6087 RepID=UPI001F5E96EB|nr:latrophilin Cirl [Hydra vulgaris]